MNHSNGLQRWLPINLLLSPANVTVKWIDFGKKRLIEPFFHQTVSALRAMDPPAAERSTELGVLLERGNRLPPVAPAGLIFHISRCGSTLLANVLRTSRDVTVLSESRVVGRLFRPNVLLNSPFPEEGWAEARRMLLNCVLACYADSASGSSSKIVIKCHTINLLYIPLIRSIWPEVPCVILIREPIEVITSNLAKPAGWARFKKRPLAARKAFGWPTIDVNELSIEEYCARAIRRFCEASRDSLDDKCRLIDYRDLDLDHIYKIAEFFKIGLAEPDSPAIARVMRTYSKDLGGSRLFEEDVERKQRVASDSSRRAAILWADEEYHALRESVSW